MMDKSDKTRRNTSNFVSVPTAYNNPNQNRNRHMSHSSAANSNPNAALKSKPHGQGLESSERSDISLGQTEYSYNFLKTKNNLQNSHQSPLRARPGKTSSKVTASMAVGAKNPTFENSGYQHTAVGKQDKLGETTQTADMYM